MSCVDLHSQNGRNYVWLNPLGYGKVLKVEFEEPVGSGRWTLYDDHWWAIHCRAVSHGADLKAAHIRAFIDPATRFARLRFYFSGLPQPIEPTAQFYDLEEQYFNGNKNKKHFLAGLLLALAAIIEFS